MGRREKFSVITGLSLVVLCFLAILALVGDVEKAGKFGAFFKGRILEPYFGKLAWILPLVGLYWGWKLLVGRGYKRALVVSLIGLLVFVVISDFHYLGTKSGSNIGGSIGLGFSARYTELLGSVGGALVLVGICFTTAWLLTGFDMRRVAKGLRGLVREFLLTVKLAFIDEHEESGILVEEEKTKEKPRKKVKLFDEKHLEAVAVSPQVQIEEPTPTLFDIKEQATSLRSKSQVESKIAAASCENNEKNSEYRNPPLSLFNIPPKESSIPKEEIEDTARNLENKLASFGIEARVSGIHPGPVITRYEIEPGTSTKVHQIVNLADDLALALKAASIRILAPIPGKGAVGIEVPNRQARPVMIRDILGSDAFKTCRSKLALAIGKDVSGYPYVADLESMPHLLIAGATGSGKSVCINTIITSLVYRNSPQDVQLILIDPKRLELTQYEGIPHLLCEIVTEAKKAVRALNWVLEEMDVRYRLLAKRGVRNIQQYEEGLPYIVVVIDELADLILTAPQEIEPALTKLAQMARAVGIHLVTATQRPSVDVITGLIKANFPCRIAFKVASKVDSRTIIDTNGAERLLGKGDMLFLAPGSPEPMRLHGAFVSPEETARLVEFLRKQSHLAAPAFSVEDLEKPHVPVEEKDELFEDAARIVITHGHGSVSLLQRRLRIGYSRAARLIDFLEEAGIVGPFEGSKARQVLVDESYLEKLSKR